MMESGVFDRRDSGEAQISPRLYNLVIGVVLCWGFWVNWMMVGNIPVESLLSISPWMFIIGYFASCFFGHFIEAQDKQA